MELFSIEFSQITKLIRLTRDSGTVYTPDFVSFLTEKYSFTYVPADSPDEKSPSVDFRVGKFRDHQIDKLSIYNDGFLVSAQANTAILDDFIEEAVHYVKDRFSLTEQTIYEPQIEYDSQIVVQGNFSIADGMSPLETATQKKLSDCFSKYGTDRKYEVVGFMMQSDPEITHGLNSSNFTLERRANVPFKKRLYYSVAPLKTDDHLELLRSLEST